MKHGGKQVDIVLEKDLIAPLVDKQAAGRKKETLGLAFVSERSKPNLSNTLSP